jgi:aryl-alcohol dehydrogenase-like predicted oxidoreductase
MSMADGRRIALGSAQFGQRYGVANRSGPPPQEAVDAIVARARGAGVDTVDTAIGYGDSEAMLGAAGVDGLRVVTKLPALAVAAAEVEGWVRAQVGASLARLGVPALHGLLLHQPSDLLGDTAISRALVDALGALKADGLVAKIGASVYHPAQLDALANVMALDLVQVPYNVLDRRFDESGWLDRLRASGTEIHVRSVFLQGLLLLDTNEMPNEFFARFHSTLDAWRTWVRERGVGPLAAALGFVLADARVDRAVVGCDSLAQWDEILAHAGARVPDVPAHLRSDDLALINPVNWPRA